MACNTCSQAFSLLRPEKGCPSCGFSYCSKCLNNKIFVEKLNTEKKVCIKCLRSKSNETVIQPPDVFYKRIAKINVVPSTSKDSNDPNKEILDRLEKLKKDNVEKVRISDEEIKDRLQNLKEKMPQTSESELYKRLANIKGVPIDILNKKPVLPLSGPRTEQEQADDLLKQYMQQTQIDSKYTEGFKDSIDSIETRLQKLKNGQSSNLVHKKPLTDNHESEDEETEIKKIIERVKVNIDLEENICPNTNDELPFCEICNEDAQVRCRGCKYLFCKRCFNEHKDDDDDCNSYDVYKPPKEA